MKNNFTFRLALMIGTMALTLQSGSAAPTPTPANAYWKGDQGSVWGTNNAGNTNWDSSQSGGVDTAAVPGSVSNVFFSANGAGNQTTTLGANFTINSLTINDPTAVTIGGTNKLTITGGNDITVNSGAGLFTVNTAGNLVLSAASTINVSNAAGAVISSQIAVAGATTSLTKTGSGTLTLTGNNKYTGQTFINAGTLAIGAGGSISNSGAVGTGAGTTFDISNGGDQTIGFLFDNGGAGTVELGANTLSINAGTGYYGTIQGTGGINKVGSGDLTLNGANTYQGGTKIKEGNLVAGSNSAFGTGNIKFQGGTLKYATGITQDFSSQFSNANDQLYSIDTNGNNVTFASALNSSNGTLTKLGNGTLTLSGNNKYTGFTYINAGTLAIGAGGSISDSGAVGTGAGATFDISNGGDQTIGFLFDNGGPGTVELGANTLSINNAVGYYGTIQGSGGIKKVGNGTVTLYGTNTYFGGTTIKDGTLSIGSDANLGDAAGELTFNGGTLQITGNITSSRNVTLKSGGGTIEVTGPAYPDPAYLDLTLSGNITGQGSLSKTGNGTLGLGGSNDYTGDTNVNEGYLYANATDTFSKKSAHVVNQNGTLDIYGYDNKIGSLSGNGTVTNEGSQATLTVGSLDTSTAFSGVIQDGNPDYNFDSFENYGILALTKVGTGTLTLTGNNTYTGGTLIKDGTISISSDNNLGAAAGELTFNGGTLQITSTLFSARTVSLKSNGGTFEVTGSSDVEEWDYTAATFSGNISGAGSLTKTGGGALILKGFNSYEGGTTVSSGLLQGDTDSLQGDILNNSNLIFDQSFDGEYAGSLTGSGLLGKINSGNLIVSGNSSSYTGNTVILGGTLSVTGTLGSGLVTVSGGATLAGNGAIIGNVSNFGTINPSSPNLSNNLSLPPDTSPIGTLTINGNLTLNPAGTLVIQLLNATTYDKVVVNGNTQLGGTLSLQALGFFLPKHGEKYTYLTTTTQTEDTFSLKTTNFGDAVTFETTTDGSQVFNSFFVAANAYESFGKTPNDKSVGKNLDQIAMNGQESFLISLLNTFSAADIEKILKLLSPEQYGAFTSLVLSYNNTQASNMERRFYELRHGATGASSGGLALINAGPLLGGGESYGKTGSLKAVKQEDPRLGFFANGTGIFGKVDSTSNAVGYNFTTGGVTAGVDYRLTDNLVIGALVGYASSVSDTRGSASKVDSDSGKAGVYGSWYDKSFYVNTSLTGGYNTYDSRRATLGGSALASPNGKEFNGYLGTGYDLSAKGFNFGPIASVQYTYIGINSFTETGSLVPLSIESSDKHSVRTHVGAQASYDLTVLGLKVTPRVSVQWQHEFLDTTTAINSRFASGSGGLFEVKSAQIGADSALIGAGVNVQITPSVDTYVDYDSEVGGQNYRSQSVNGGLRVKF